VKIADLEGHCLFLNKAGVRRWRQICRKFSAILSCCIKQPSFRKPRKI